MPATSPPTVSTGQSATAQCDASRFYRQVLQTLTDAHIPFLLGGAFALHHFTGIERDTKDLDLFIRREDYDRASAILEEAGFATDLTYPHWLAKVRQGDAFIDLIFNSGNGLTLVDDEWFQHASDSEVLGVPVKVHPAEEMLWSKAFIMERERYDGADVAHIIQACAKNLDWPRLLRRFDPHWRVLLSHLVLFGFIYPDRRSDVPGWVMDELLERARRDAKENEAKHVCGGTLLSREQYLDDVAAAGYRDGRLEPPGHMNEEDIAQWTRAIAEPK
jgi:predicted nucleotidyltransferase